MQEAIEAIENKEGMKPLVVATSARVIAGLPRVSYTDQERIWKTGRPVLFIFGTGRGLTDECVQKSDFLLEPLYGFSEFNHLSVRSAVAIVLDRWLGLHPESTE